MSRFAKYAWFVLAWNVLVILWGAFVRATGSGAGCGSHWPVCNGTVIPTLQSIETVIEYVHRVMSGADLFMILGLLILGLRLYPKSSPVRMGVIGSAVFILVESGLGAMLVLLNLVNKNESAFRAAAVAIHLLNTLVLLAFLALTAWWASGGKAISLKGKNRTALWLGIGLGGVALIGMMGAVTALGDTLFPAQTLAQGLAQDADANASFLIRLRVIHPIIAVLVGIYTLNLAWSIFKRSANPLAQKLCLALGGLVLAQWGAGLLTLLLLAPIWMQMVHLFLADSVWTSYILLSASVLSMER